MTSAVSTLCALFPMSVLAQDPTDMSSPTGKIVVLLGLLVALGVTGRWLWQHRKR